jgi:hypothetical protein
MSVFFNQYGILVTDRVFIADQARYDIRQLSDATHGTGSLHPGVRACALVGVANAVVLGAAAATTQSLAVVLVGVSALLISWAVGLFYTRRWPRQHVLLASYRGRRVTLLRTRDQDLFGRVSRALRRAMETSFSESPF